MFVLEIFKEKKALKLTNQLVIFIDFSCPHDPKSEIKSRKSTNKNILA